MYPLKKLRNIQRKAAIWILGVFCTSLPLSIEAVAGLISIYIHLQKLSRRFQLRMHMLLQNNIVKSFLESRHMNDSNIYQLLLERITPRQWLLLKEPIVDANNGLNRVFSSFDLFSSEFSSGDKLINVFSSCFFFYSMNRRNEENIKCIFVNSMKLYSKCYQIPKQLLLY